MKRLRKPLGYMMLTLALSIVAFAVMEIVPYAVDPKWTDQTLVDQLEKPIN